MLTEKVVLVTSPLLCAMPPLRLPGMPPPWCFFWLPTIVSMEWLRTRMALCGRRGRGTAGHHRPAGTDPKPPPQPQVSPGHIAEHPARSSPESRRTPTTIRQVTAAAIAPRGLRMSRPSGSPTATTRSDSPPIASVTLGARAEDCSYGTGSTRHELGALPPARCLANLPKPLSRNRDHSRVISQCLDAHTPPRLSLDSERTGLARSLLPCLLPAPLLCADRPLQPAPKHPQSWKIHSCFTKVLLFFSVLMLEKYV